MGEDIELTVEGVMELGRMLCFLGRMFCWLGEYVRVVVEVVLFFSF